MKRYTHSKILKEKVDRISLDYRIKNGNGDYIAEIILDTVNSVEYKVESNKSGIEIISAKSRPTSFNVTFAIDEKYKDGDALLGKNMKLVDEEGKEYLSSGFSIDSKDNKIIISTNFPLSSYENVNKFKLVIASIGEVEFVK